MSTKKKKKSPARSLDLLDAGKTLLQNKLVLAGLGLVVVLGVASKGHSMLQAARLDGCNKALHAAIPQVPAQCVIVQGGKLEARVDPTIGGPAIYFDLDTGNPDESAKE